MSERLSSFPQQRSSRLSLSCAETIVGRKPRVTPRARAPEAAKWGLRPDKNSPSTSLAREGRWRVRLFRPRPVNVIRAIPDSACTLSLYKHWSMQLVQCTT
jgi:hypothetical protein